MEALGFGKLQQLLVLKGKLKTAMEKEAIIV